MGSGMPYHREKGDTWETFDSFFSHSDLNIRARHKLATLEHLWSPPPIGRFTAMAESESPATPYVQDGPPAGLGVWQPFFTGLVYHANVDWFGSGIPKDPITGAPFTAANPGLTDSYYETTTAKPRFGVDPDLVLTNGWWKNWFGENTEGIVRDAYIRAIEVSLGLSHPDDVSVAAARDAAATTGGEIISGLYFLPDDGGNTTWAASLTGSENQNEEAFENLAARFTRNWPIDFWWTCGMPWFQAWISWAEGEGNPVPQPSVSSGRVVVTWLTPGSTLHTINRDLTNLPRAQQAPVVVGSPTVYADKRFGSWLIAHTKNDTVNNISYFPTHAYEEWPLPVPTNYSYEAVVTIDPPFEDGGIGQPIQLGPGRDQF